MHPFSSYRHIFFSHEIIDDISSDKQRTGKQRYFILKKKIIITKKGWA